MAVTQTASHESQSLFTQQKPTIAIQIHDEIHRKIPQARISLINEKGEVQGEVQEEGLTDDNGIWGKYEIQPGEYIVSVEYPGAETTSSTVVVTNQQAVVLQLGLQLHGAPLVLDTPKPLHIEPDVAPFQTGMAEVVEVSSNFYRSPDEIVDIDSPDPNQVLRELVGMPLPTERSSTELLSLTPGRQSLRKGFLVRLWHKLRF